MLTYACEECSCVVQLITLQTYIRLSLIIFIQLADATASLAKKSGVGIELILLRNVDDTADILRLALVSMCMQLPFTLI